MHGDEKLGSVSSQHIRTVCRLIDMGFIRATATIVVLPDVNERRILTVTCQGMINIFLTPKYFSQPVMLGTDTDPEINTKLKAFYDVLDDTNLLLNLVGVRIDEDTLMKFHS